VLPRTGLSLESRPGSFLESADESWTHLAAGAAPSTRSETENPDDTLDAGSAAAVVTARGGGVDVEARPRRWTDGARDPERTVTVAVTYAEVSREVLRSRIDGWRDGRADRRGRAETAGTPPPTLMFIAVLVARYIHEGEGVARDGVPRARRAAVGGTRADRWCHPGGR
jgi:hypothetical protein